MTLRPRIAVLISGSGRSLRNLIELRAQGKLNAEIELVISSSAKAGGIRYAEEAKIATLVVERRSFANDAEFSEANFAAIRKSRVDFVVMAGYLKLLPIPADFENRVINIHPALIPMFCGHGFYGHHVHQAAIEYGVKISGCTVHFVDNLYDHGPIIMQRTVSVAPDDDADRLASRVFQAELEALPEVINLLAAGRVVIEGRKVSVR